MFIKHNITYGKGWVRVKPVHAPGYLFQNRASVLLYFHCHCLSAFCSTGPLDSMMAICLEKGFPLCDAVLGVCVPFQFDAFGI